jgi:hypothetical protein
MNLVAKWCSLRLRMNRSKFTRYGLRGAVGLNSTAGELLLRPYSLVVAQSSCTLLVAGCFGRFGRE